MSMLPRPVGLAIFAFLVRTSCPPIFSLSCPLFAFGYKQKITVSWICESKIAKNERMNRYLWIASKDIVQKLIPKMRMRMHGREQASLSD